MPGMPEGMDFSKMMSQMGGAPGGDPNQINDDSDEEE